MPDEPVETERQAAETATALAQHTTEIARAVEAERTALAKDLAKEREELATSLADKQAALALELARELRQFRREMRLLYLGVVVLVIAVLLLR